MRFHPLSYFAFAAVLFAAGMAMAAAVENEQQPVEVTADQSLEWYQEQHVYVARGNAKAVRGELVVEADMLTAHERDKPVSADAKDTKKPKDKSISSGSGDIDKMTAEGNVRITDEAKRVTGDHAVYDIDRHIIAVTGEHLKYETETESVTAKQSLEYWEDKGMAVARGNAVASRADRHVEGDILTAEFTHAPGGVSQLVRMTGEGHVNVVTRGDVARGDRMVYDAMRNIAVISGNVRITRADGTQLAGDVGEVDFANSRSRLLNQGKGRVRALLSSHPGSGDTTKTAAEVP